MVFSDYCRASPREKKNVFEVIAMGVGTTAPGFPTTYPATLWFTLRGPLPVVDDNQTLVGALVVVGAIIMSIFH